MRVKAGSVAFSAGGRLLKRLHSVMPKLPGDQISFVPKDDGMTAIFARAESTNLTEMGFFAEAGYENGKLSGFMGKVGFLFQL